MDSALLQNLIAGAGSSSQLIGGLVVALLYLVIGLLSAIGSIFVFRRMFQERWEQIFWACFLVVIAAFYLSFAAYFGASPHAWRTELIGVAVFLFCALCGLFSRSAIAVGYVMQALGFIPFLVRRFICRHVDNGYSAGLRHLLLDLRFCGRRLSHDQRHRVARRGQGRSLLLATAHVIPQ
jgi:hypothetical protein